MPDSSAGILAAGTPSTLCPPGEIPATTLTEDSSAVPALQRILIVKSCRFGAELLQRFVQSLYLAAVIVSVCTVSGAMAALQQQQSDGPYDLLLCDVVAEDCDSLDLLPYWRSRFARRALVLTSHREPAVLRALSELPIDGVYDELGDGMANLNLAIATVCRGQLYWSSALCQTLARSCLAPRSPLRLLTPNERVVFGVIGDGCDDATAAGQLGLSVATVKSIRRDLHRKFGVSHKGELLQKAAEIGVVIKTPYGFFRPGLAPLLRKRLHRRLERELLHRDERPAA